MEVVILRLPLPRPLTLFAPTEQKQVVEPTQALQPTAEAPQLTAEAVSCLYGVGCSYESPIHNHTDCFSWQYGYTKLARCTQNRRRKHYSRQLKQSAINTNPRAGTRANATIPTALAGGMEIRSWRSAHKTDDASTTADS